jgi:glycosyltransferase involved in cell wall biosynthesis
MKVIVTIAGLDMRSGGPSRTVPALCSAMAAEGAKVEIVAVRENKMEAVNKSLEGLDLRVISTGTSRYDPLSWRREFQLCVEKALDTAESPVIYDVGLWLPSNHYARIVARRRKVPFVASPRGMLSERALQVSKLRKRMAWLAYQKRDLLAADAFHATSAAEADDIRARGVRKPIAVIPNGVNLPNAERNRSRRDHRKTVLFLSRLHPIKGIEDLITAWARLQPQGWRVVLAGPDEKNYRAKLEALVRQLDLGQAISFRGPVTDVEKWGLYGQADLFVLPSYSESFGQVIAEALASGLPVVTTKATPWQEVEASNCGWWIEPGVESLITALNEAVNCTFDNLHAMGQRGRTLIREKYSWNVAAKQMLALFAWLQQPTTPKPACIRLNE